MIRSMLGLRGDRVGEFYSAIDGNESARAQLVQWNLREELFELSLEVERGADWAPAAVLRGGGPFISERRAVAIPLEGVTGDRVRMRIHPPVGFWTLNSFQLAWGEEAAAVTPAPLLSATDESGADVRHLLSTADESYLLQPTTRHQTELVFAAPDPVPAMERTIFAETQGWYGIHLRGGGPPDAARLLRLSEEPGYPVRLAYEEYQEFQRTGVLKGVLASIEP
jgi:hypothetical protein